MTHNILPEILKNLPELTWLAGWMTPTLEHNDAKFPPAHNDTGESTNTISVNSSSAKTSQDEKSFLAPQFRALFFLLRKKARNCNGSDEISYWEAEDTIFKFV